MLDGRVCLGWAGLWQRGTRTALHCWKCSRCGVLEVRSEGTLMIAPALGRVGGVREGRREQQWRCGVLDASAFQNLSDEFLPKCVSRGSVVVTESFGASLQALITQTCALRAYRIPEVKAFIRY